MEDSDRQNTDSQAYQGIARQEVLQPSEPFMQEVHVSPQPASDQTQPVPQVTPQTAPPASARPRLITKKRLLILGASLLFVAAAVTLLARNVIFPNGSTRTGHGSISTANSSTVSYTKLTELTNGVQYSIVFDSKATTLVSNGVTFLLGKDKSGHLMRLAVERSPAKADCYPPAGINGISIIARPQVEGQPHNLCYSQILTAYVMGFTHNGVWYGMAVYPMVKGQVIDQDTVIMIASSIRITQ
jgi:hypothetical protein